MESSFELDSLCSEPLLDQLEESRVVAREQELGDFTQGRGFVTLREW